MHLQCALALLLRARAMPSRALCQRAAFSSLPSSRVVAGLLRGLLVAKAGVVDEVEDKIGLRQHTRQRQAGR